MTLARVQHHHAHVASVLAENGHAAATGRCSASRSTAPGTATTPRCGEGRCCSPTTAATSGSPTSPTSRSRAGTRRSAGPTGWPSRTCTPPASPGTRTCRASAVAPQRERVRARAPAAHRAGVRADVVAWAGSSTPSRRSPGCATTPATRRRRRWSCRRSRSSRYGERADGEPGAYPLPLLAPARSGPLRVGRGALVRAVADDVRAGVARRRWSASGSTAAWRPRSCAWRCTPGARTGCRRSRSAAASSPNALLLSLTSRGLREAGLRGAAAPPGARQRRGSGAGPGRSSARRRRCRSSTCRSERAAGRHCVGAAHGSPRPPRGRRRSRAYRCRP